MENKLVYSILAFAIKGIVSGKETVHTRSEERRVGKSVDLGGRRIIKKKNKTKRATLKGLYKLAATACTPPLHHTVLHIDHHTQTRT